jgi:hypothetical protein
MASAEGEVRSERRGCCSCSDAPDERAGSARRLRTSGAPGRRRPSTSRVEHQQGQPEVEKVDRGEEALARSHLALVAGIADSLGARRRRDSSSPASRVHDSRHSVLHASEWLEGRAGAETHFLQVDVQKGNLLRA